MCSVPTTGGHSNASACIIKRFVCVYVPVVAHPVFIFGEARTHYHHKVPKRTQEMNRGRQYSRENKR